MSALCPKQTFWKVSAMSALIPKADIARIHRISAKCQKRTPARADNVLFSQHKTSTRCVDEYESSEPNPLCGLYARI
jgi:hypothetical protein